MKSTLAITLGVVSATLMYGVGLVAPLTPSEGIPRLWELLIFLVCPCVLLLVCAWASSSRLTKALLVLLSFMFCGFGLWLLRMQLSTI